jgi:SNF2 family DNA or RNA helicase
MTLALRARLDPDGHGLLLESRNGLTDLTVVRAAFPGVRMRRHPKGAVIGLWDGSALLDAPDITWDDDALRGLRNRRAVTDVAPNLLSQIERLKAADIEHVRRLIDDSRLVARLDIHQLRNLAALTLPGGWGGCVFDEQGTGKTVTMIATFDLLVERNEADVLLVVCPKTMAAEWAAEFERFTGGLYRVAVAADGSRAARAAALDRGADVIVVNYETAMAMSASLRALARRSRLILAVDESFFVKNPTAARTTAVMQLREWCVRAYALCGTPAPNSPADLVAQFDLVDFGYTFKDTTLTGDRDTDRAPVRDAMIARGLYVRNLKTSVLTLPDRRFEDVLVDLSPRQQRAYDDLAGGLVDDLRAVDDATFGRKRASFLARRAQLLRLCSDPAGVLPDYQETPSKDEALDALLRQLIERDGEKVVLWSFYRATLDRLAERFRRYGLVRIDGSVTDTAMRRAAVRKFQEDEGIRIFLGNPAAAGAGITLHRSCTTIYESLSNQAAHHLQSLDRVHRRGQSRDVSYVTLLARGTLEEVEYQRLRDKATSQADLLGDEAPAAVTRQVLLDELINTARTSTGSL